MVVLATEKQAALISKWEAILNNSIKDPSAVDSTCNEIEVNLDALTPTLVFCKHEVIYRPKDMRLNLTQQLLLKTFFHSLSRVQEMGKRILLFLCAADGGLAIFLSSSLFSTALESLRDEKNTSKAQLVANLFLELSNQVNLSEHISVDFQAWCKESLAMSAIIRCRVYDLVISLRKVVGDQFVATICQSLAEELDSSDLTLVMNALELGIRITRWENGDKVLSASGFLNKAFAFLDKFCTPEADPLEKEILTPSIFSFLAELVKSSPSLLPELDSKHNLVNIFKLGVEEDDTFTSHTLFLVGACWSTRSGLDWIVSKYPGIVANAVDLVKYRTGVVKSSALYCLTNLLEREGTAPEDINGVAKRLYDALNGLAGIIGFLSRSPEERDQRIKYETIRTILRRPDVSSILDSEFISKLQARLQEKTEAIPAVAYVEA
ncbi:hypothetical protein HDU96_003466 [Phlyctochytrium bullatum]|nr:hypothetical protein HDU96_003466 [Phlyctochytrium bullatum]